MSRVNYYLNNKGNNKGYSTILLYFSFKALRIPVATNESVQIKAWNKKMQRVRLSYNEGKSINDRLDDLELRVKKMFREDFCDVAPRRNIVKEKIQEIINPPEEFGSNNFISFAEAYTLNCQKKPNTKKNYSQAINHLKDFKAKSKEYKKMIFLLMTLTWIFMISFIHIWKKILSSAKNTIGGHFKNIKVFMKQSFERKLHKNESFRLSGL